METRPAATKNAAELLKMAFTSHLQKIIVFGSFRYHRSIQWKKSNQFSGVITM